MDSRRYRFIYRLKGNTDIPADFPHEVRNLPFETGVFMPQDDSNWFNRPPKYPARLLLLEGRSLHIFPHPTSGQLPVEIKLDDLVQLETGCVLLTGWIKLTSRTGIQGLAYNTRASQPLEEFLSLLKLRWLDTGSPAPDAGAQIYGDELDIKFNCSLRDELVRDESVLLRYFQAPVPLERKGLLFRNINWRPRSLILLTSRERIVWITDRYRGRRELYASVSFSARSVLLVGCKLEEADGRCFASISFSSGISWRVPVYGISQELYPIFQAVNQFSRASIVSNEA